LSTLNGSTIPPLIKVPLYIQIADQLISQIESGELQPGSQLTPERQLSTQMQVNRMTLRRALQVLQAQGLLVRKHGIGTFIADRKIDRQMETIFRFTSGMQNKGLNPGTKLIWVDVIPADPKIAEDLALHSSDQVFDILRLRSINQEPVMLESYKISLSRFPHLDRFNLEARSIYEIFETEFGVNINRSRQSFEPITATRYEAELLGIEVGTALMLETRVSYDDQDQPIEFGKDRYRGDRFRFVTETARFDFASLESQARQPLEII
jgi:GntR family transcriptional regulator